MGIEAPTAELRDSVAEDRGGSEEDSPDFKLPSSLAPERHDSQQSGAQPDGVGGTTKQSQASADTAQLRDQQQQQYSEQTSVQNTHHVVALPSIHTAIVPSSGVQQRSPHHVSPAGTGLHLRTNMLHGGNGFSAQLNETPRIIYETPVSTEPGLQQSLVHLAGVGTSLRSNLSTSSMTSSVSPGSALPSPYLAAMADLTPLPSPLVAADPSVPWRKPQPGTPNRSPRTSLDDVTPAPQQSTPTSPPRRKRYGSLVQEATTANAVAVQDNAHSFGKSKGHGRNRSISDFVPEQLHNIRQRHVTFGSGDGSNAGAIDYSMQREAYVAAQRGLAAPSRDAPKQMPTPPASNSSVAESDELDEELPSLDEGSSIEYLEIHCGIHHKRRKFRQLRQLGQGTFSKVMLATRERIPAHITPEIEDSLDPHKVVAVKIVEHGPAGGADEERIETSLKREVEMLKSVSHPSLIHLKACEYQETRALLVLTYCPGGDLFELASQKRDLLTAPMVQRMFAELVSAVQYLHENWIVHRDIKLENVLVNVREDVLRSIKDPSTSPAPIITLTDLGLSRRIPQPPESPLLTTRCGSEDYAAPEILLGQPYDGRLTDAWALGVLLYALMEGRLPFDAPPGKPDRSRNTHRIARCDWIWCRFGDEDGEWDSNRGKDFEGARVAVEGLLKKVRMGRKPLQEVEQLQWVQDGIRVPGGLQMREDDDDNL